MGYAAPTGKFEAHYMNGAPLAGGQVWTYQAGTSTPATTYADQGLTIANANPVILDAAGRADLWIPDASVMTYKWVVQDANGVLQYTANGVSITPPPGTTGAPPPTGGGGTTVYYLMPSGLICPFGGTGVPLASGGGPALNPDGSQAWLACDGSSYSATTYANLYAVVQNKFGQTGGAGYFNVPDLRGHFPLGVAVSGTGSVIGQTGGQLGHQHSIGTHSHAQTDHTHPMPHGHTIPHTNWQAGSYTAPVAAPPAGQLVVTYSGMPSGMPALADGATSALDTPSTSNAGAMNTGPNSPANQNTTTPTGASVDPPFVAVNYIIKT
jgi:microcystin-dependent protein